MTIELSAFSDDAPSGENLEYEQIFTDLTLAARPEDERQMGDEIIAGTEPEPKPLVECAKAVLEQSHDLRAAVLYGYGQMRLTGFAGLAEATGYLRGALEQFWDTCHPQLDADDDDDPTMRVNAVTGLVDGATILRNARLTPLTKSASFGRLSLRDIAIADGETAVPEGMDNPPTAQTVSAAFQDTPPEALTEVLEALRAIDGDLAAIDAVFDTHLPGRGPTLDPLRVVVKKALTHVAGAIGVPEEEEAPEAAADSGAAPAAPAPSAAPGVISSRADVEKTLERIMDYYAKNEPSSPLPLLLARARRLVGADFMTIMNDIAPAGAENARLIGGLEGMENPE